MQNEEDLYNYKTYSAIDFVIGLFITLGASVVNALGLNITKLDFTRQEALPASSRKPDYLRGFWWIGLILYVASQVLGSTLALEFLRAEYVAPLGSTSLIFNFIFAFLLVGTPVTRTDVLGTLVIVIGVVGVVLFGNHRKETADFDKESNLSLSLLKEIWGRSDWIAYLTCLECVTVAFFWLSTIVHSVCMARVTDDRDEIEHDGTRVDDMLEGGGGRRGSEAPGFIGQVRSISTRAKKGHGQFRSYVRRLVDRWSQSKPDSAIRKAAGLCWSIAGGLLAGQTLVFAKSAVKLVSSAISHSDPNEANQFTSPLSWLIVILLVVAAVAQVFCLNASLKCYDSTFTVPIFFATYTTCGFINSLVYLDELHTYELWVFLCIWASIAVLIIGVILLSTKKPQARARATSLSKDENYGEESGAVGTPDGGSTNRDPFNTVEGGRPQLNREFESEGEQGSFVMNDSESERNVLPEKGQGFLAKLFGGGPKAQLSHGEDLNTMEMGRRARRRRKGVQKLGDNDSGDEQMTASTKENEAVFNLERESEGAVEVDRDEIDGLGDSEYDSIVRRKESHERVRELGDGAFEAVDHSDNESDFGDFKDGVENVEDTSKPSSALR